jgi:hypothetical protein
LRPIDSSAVFKIHSGEGLAHIVGVSSSLPLFTSIRPPTGDDELSYLRDCLSSWRAAGFQPVAVNGPSETAALRGLNLPIEFAPIAADGKPRISAILSAIRASGEHLAGIINSDCQIMGYPGLASTIREELDRSCILAWRVDIGEGIRPAATSHGFDAYFFDTRFLPEDDIGFSIGDPWWDYWFPLACEMRGAKLQTLGLPLLTHKVHPLNWQRRKWEAGAHRFWTALCGWRPEAAAPGSVFNEIPVGWWTQERLSASRVGSLSLIVPAWFFRERPQTIAVLPAEMAAVETMLQLGGQALLDAAEFVLLKNILRRAIKPLRRAVAVFRRVRQAVAALALPPRQSAV